MNTAQYVVIRYIADAARNESLNVGIIIWTDTQYRIEINQEAVERVIRENPRLDSEALSYIEPLMRKRLGAELTLDRRRIDGLLSSQRGFPIVLTEPRQASLGDGHPSVQIEVALDRLVNRIIRPRRRAGGGDLNPTSEIEAQIRPLLKSRHIMPKHPFEVSRSGVMRSVDFYVNSNASVAVDAIKLAIKNVKDIRVRADAQAYKIVDLMEFNRLDFLVYCQISTLHEEQDEPIQNAMQIIQSTGARVVTRPEVAARFLAEAVRQNRGSRKALFEP